MAEYVKRDDVRDMLHDEMEACGNGAEEIDALLKANDRLFQIPAADVAPVVHGRWIPFHSEAAGDIQYCSACDVGCTWKPNYCPNCGADMRGE